MSVQLLYFAVLRERAGCTSEEIELQGSPTVGELYRARFPPGPLGLLPVAFAVNKVYARADQVVEDGDEVAFLPPLGGG